MKQKIWMDLGRISFGIIFLVFALFMFINTSLFFPDNAENMQYMIIIYLVSVAFAYALLMNRNEIYDVPLSKGLPAYIIFFVATYFVLGLLTYDIFGSGLLSLGVALPFALITAFVVAHAEELIFRGLFNKHLGIIFSSILFALFHFVVSNGNWSLMILFFALGLIWSFMNSRMNLGVIPSMASHTAYNLVAINSAMLLYGVI